MLEFPEQLLELSMPVGRGTKGPPRPPVGSTWTDNDYLNLRALFYIIRSSGRSPEGLCLRLGTLGRPSGRPTVRL